MTTTRSPAENPAGPATTAAFTNAAELASPTGRPGETAGPESDDRSAAIAVFAAWLAAAGIGVLVWRSRSGTHDPVVLGVLAGGLLAAVPVGGLAAAGALRRGARGWLAGMIGATAGLAAAVAALSLLLLR